MKKSKRIWMFKKLLWDKIIEMNIMNMSNICGIIRGKKFLKLKI